MDSTLRVLKYAVSICIKIKSAVPTDRLQTGASTVDLEPTCRQIHTKKNIHKIELKTHQTISMNHVSC